jgi:hypothetical protein
MPTLSTPMRTKLSQTWRAGTHDGRRSCRGLFRLAILFPIQAQLVDSGAGVH